MFCTHCGQTNADDARFCQRCGQPFAATTNRLAQPPIHFAPPPPPQQPVNFAAAPPGVDAPPPTDYSAYAADYGSVQRETDVKAIISLICGVLFFAFPMAIAAIVLGHMSRSDIEKSGGRKQGAGMALAGLILGYLGVSFIPIMIIAAIAIPSLIHTKVVANEATAVQNVRQIVTTEIEFQKNKNAYTCEASEFSGNVRELLEPGARPKSGYLYAVYGCSETAFKVVAWPVVNNSTGRYTYCSDASGEIRQVQGQVPGEGGADSCLKDGTTVQ